MRRMVVQRLEAVLEIAPGVVADDDNREGVHAAASSAANVSAPARVHEYRASTAGPASSTRRRTSSSNSRSFSAAVVPAISPLSTYSAASAAHFAGDVRVEQHGRHAGTERLEWRMAKSLVLREQRERTRPPIQFCELGVEHIRPNRHARGDPFRCSDCRQDPRADTCDCPRRSPGARQHGAFAIGLNARIRSGMWRRLNTEPTKSTIGSRAVSNPRMLLAAQ